MVCFSCFTKMTALLMKSLPFALWFPRPVCGSRSETETDPPRFEARCWIRVPWDVHPNGVGMLVHPPPDIESTAYVGRNLHDSPRAWEIAARAQECFLVGGFNKLEKY